MKAIKACADTIIAYFVYLFQISPVRRKRVSSGTLYHQRIERGLQAFISGKSYRDRNTNLDAIARACMSNRTYVSIYINNVYRCSVRELITRLRIEDAKGMLMQKAITQEEIARKVGFCDAASFNRHFKAVEGVTPLTWKNKQKTL